MIAYSAGSQSLRPCFSKSNRRTDNYDLPAFLQGAQGLCPTFKTWKIILSSSVTLM